MIFYTLGITSVYHIIDYAFNQNGNTPLKPEIEVELAYRARYQAISLKSVEEANVESLGFYQLTKIGSYFNF